MTDGIYRFDHWKDHTIGSIVVVCILYWIPRRWRHDTIGTVISTFCDWLGVRRSTVGIRYSQHDNVTTPQLQASKKRLRRIVQGEFLVVEGPTG